MRKALLATVAGASLLFTTSAVFASGGRNSSPITSLAQSNISSAQQSVLGTFGGAGGNGGNGGNGGPAFGGWGGVNIAVAPTVNIGSGDATGASITQISSGGNAAGGNGSGGGNGGAGGPASGFSFPHF